jgi:hypothetical protein
MQGRIDGTADQSLVAEEDRIFERYDRLEDGPQTAVLHYFAQLFRQLPLAGLRFDLRSRHLRQIRKLPEVSLIDASCGA